MDFYSLSDKVIAEELGRRIRELRLQRNITQKQLAEATTLSLNAIKALESGKGKLSTIIAVLRELGALDALDSFIPPPTISPLEMLKTQGKSRRRASGMRTRGKDIAEW